MLNPRIVGCDIRERGEVRKECVCSCKLFCKFLKEILRYSQLSVVLCACVRRMGPKILVVVAKEFFELFSVQQGTTSNDIPVYEARKSLAYEVRKITICSQFIPMKFREIPIRSAPSQQ